MSTFPEAEFDLEKLFLPAWAQEAPSANRYAKYTGQEGAGASEDRGERRRGPRRDGPRPPRREGGRPGGPGPGPGPRFEGQRGPRREGGGPEGQRGPRRGGRDFRKGGREREERREVTAPLPDVLVVLMPDDKGVDSLSRQIKMSGRSFPLFGIAQMILQKPERQQVRFEVKKKADGQISQPLFLCAIDDSLWLSEEEAVSHALGRHFGLFYQTEKTPTDPPKGTYTFVAQCGMSGIILGPPNYHDYQNQLHRLHTERFSRMPFEVFKSRVKIVKEEAVVKKWIEDQSFKTEYVCLNLPEAKKLSSREEVEKHFREAHLPNIIKQVEKHLMSGPASRQLRSPGLQRLLRQAWEDQKRFPLQVATILSQQFASHGLQFFKVNKTVTHVSVARPHFLDMVATPVSDQVKRIVHHIDATPKCTRRQLIEALAPAPTPPQPAPIVIPHEGEPAPAAEPTAPATEGAATAASAPASTAPPAPTAAPATPPGEPEPTPEQASIIGDLHWLIHQGHVIEFANGVLETAKRPAPRPPKPPKPETAPKAEAAQATAEASAAEAASATPETPGAESSEPAGLMPAAAESQVVEQAAPLESDLKHELPDGTAAAASAAAVAPDEPAVTPSGEGTTTPN